MAKNKKGGFRRPVLKLGITLLVINQLIIPVAGSCVWSIFPMIKTNKSKVQEYKKIPQNFTALDYVNLSNMIVNHYSERGRLCRNYSKETFGVYQELIKQNNRKDLKRDIKLAAGKYGYTLKEDAHMWVEVKHEGNWIKYESTGYTPKLEMDKIKEYSKESLKYKMDLSKDDSKLVKIAQTFNGTKIFYPKPASLINGGVVEVSYLAYKLSKENFIK